MPGCLGMDALWQLVGFFLGWAGGEGLAALSVGEVKFTGQILPTNKLVRYEIDMKRVIMRRLVMGIADSRVVCDGETVFEANDIRVGLFKPEGLIMRRVAMPVSRSCPRSATMSPRSRNPS